MKLNSILSFVFIGLSFLLGAQNPGWHLQKADVDGAVGISAHNIYTQSLKGKASQTVVVAVIDSGVDIEHEDLKDNIWVNSGEIPDNGIDDDKNGYIDDVNGWNFIGGEKGNVHNETYEATRLLKKLKYKYESANPAKLNKSDKKEYDIYVKVKEEVEKEYEKAQISYNNILGMEKNVIGGLDAVEKMIGDQPINLETLQTIEPNGDQNIAMGKNILLDQIVRGEKVESVAAIKSLILDDIAGGKDYYGGKVKYAYNLDFDPRHLVGDNYADGNEKYYGNNDVDGPDSRHGTHVAGIIGAVRNNELGIDGVADNVKIMSVRTVPNGDERDKDVANAIRYAVDNGASIINMSFGKGYSWDEKLVENAIKYAEKNDVLLVHAAGNDSQDKDTKQSFPNDDYMGKGFLFFKGKKKHYKNWLSVGALNYENGKNLVAPFSNYGAENVDLFAPGMKIFATTPDNNYDNMQGTSMAAPVVAGVAAVLRSYYPSLTAVQVKNILMASVTKENDKVILPGTSDTMVPFSQLSISGGVVNAQEAVKLANKTKGKKKISKVIKA